MSRYNQWTRNYSSPMLVMSLFCCSAALASRDDEPVSPLVLALGAAGQGSDNALQTLRELRKLRNSRTTLDDVGRLTTVTQTVEAAMKMAYEANATSRDSSHGRRPGNFHGVKSHTYYVGAISEAHPSLPYDAVQSIVASEWYHPGLTAKAVWCEEGCGEQFRLARLLDTNFELISKEVSAFWKHPDAAAELQGVGSHTTQFDKLIAGNGTWIDVRLWRGRAYNRRLCEKHFRVICSIVESSPEIWSNPWSHVLLSVLLDDSWVPFHQGHSNGQLTYHLPVTVPSELGVAELAVVDRGGSLPEDTKKERQMLIHPEERIVKWRQGKTLVFDDSFTHAVRFRSFGTVAPPPTKVLASTISTGARVVLLMRGWHPELGPDERESLRDFVRRGGEEDPEGYEMLPITKSVFSL